jgi:hypothetical protein
MRWKSFFGHTLPPWCSVLPQAQSNGANCSWTRFSKMEPKWTLQVDYLRYFVIIMENWLTQHVTHCVPIPQNTEHCREALFPKTWTQTLWSWELFTKDLQILKCTPTWAHNTSQMYMHHCKKMCQNSQFKPSSWGRLKQEDLKFKASLGYIQSLRPAWDT